jgi:hypothetical protein
MGSPSPQSVTSTEYRRKKGFSRQRLSALKKKGKIKFTPDGKIDPAASDAAIMAAQVAAQQFQQRSAARQLLEYYQAQKAKLEYETSVGSLVPRDEIERQAFTMARKVRDKFFNIPDRIDGLVVAAVRSTKDDTTARRKVREMLTKELHHAAASLGNGTNGTGKHK